MKDAENPRRKLEESKASVEVSTKSIISRFYSFTFSKAATRRFRCKMIAQRSDEIPGWHKVESVKESGKAEKRLRRIRARDIARVTFHPEDGKLDGYIGSDSAVER